MVNGEGALPTYLGESIQSVGGWTWGKSLSSASFSRTVFLFVMGSVPSLTDRSCREQDGVVIRCHGFVKDSNIQDLPAAWRPGQHVVDLLGRIGRTVGRHGLTEKGQPPTLVGEVEQRRAAWNSVQVASQERKAR